MSEVVALSVTDQLEACETVIRRGLATFVEVGTALATIRDERLYRESHETFEDYCREAWGFDDRRAREYITAASAATVIGEISPVAISNAGQAREVAAIIKAEGAERAAEVLAEVAEAGPVTARAIRETARPTREPITVDASTGEIVEPRQTAEQYASEGEGMRRANLRKQFSNWLASAAPTPGFDPTELAAIVGDDELKVAMLHAAGRRVSEWINEFDAAIESGRGLRLVKGNGR